MLRPGGRLGLVWNTRDERLGWVKDLGRIIGHENDPFTAEVSLPEPFTDVDRRHVEWTSYLTPQALIDLVASRSYCITSPAEVRTRTLDQVRELLATHPALANSSGLALPYITVCIRATLPRLTRSAGAQRVDGPGDVDHHHGHGRHGGEVDVRGSAPTSRPARSSDSTSRRRPPPRPRCRSAAHRAARSPRPPTRTPAGRSPTTLRIGHCARTTRRTKATASSRVGSRRRARAVTAPLRPVRRRWSAGRPGSADRRRRGSARRGRRPPTRRGARHR